MTHRTLGLSLLVAFAIVGLAFAAPAVSAHGDGPTPGNQTAADERPADTDTADRTAWMAAHVTEHMGPDAIEAMESHMGVSVGEMTRGMATDDHGSGGMTGQGHGC